MGELEKKLQIIKDACEDKKAMDLEVLDIGKMSTIGDYFIIVSANTSNQAQSIADEIEDKMEKAGYEQISKDGYKSGRWILLDFVDIIVHIFHKEERDYYKLERLWTEERQEEN